MRGFHLGKVLGFRIDVDWSWLLVFVLVVYSLAEGFFLRFHFDIVTTWVVAFVSAILLFASVLAHELTHSIVARQNGIDIKGITLFIFGGVSQTKSEPQTPWVEFKMAIAGPAMSFGIAVFFWGLSRVGLTYAWPQPAVAIFGYVGFINVLLGAFNLVPGFPLDGGRVLRSAIWWATNDLRRSTQLASSVGQGFGYLLMAIGFFRLVQADVIGGLWMIFIGWFLSGAARQSYEQLVLREALSGVPVRSVMTADVPSVPAQMSVQDFVHDYLLRQDFQAYPVVSDDHLVGIVDVEQVRGLPREVWPVVPVERIARPVEEERTVSPSDDAWQALMQLAELDARRLIVTENGHVEGMVTRENLFHLVRIKAELGV